MLSSSTLTFMASTVIWPFVDSSAEQVQRHLLTDVYMQALRDLAPDMGSYLNEVSSGTRIALRPLQPDLIIQGDVNEPNFAEAFWGDNYPRLLSIKRLVDPDDVFWCRACVGREGWEEEGNTLCRV